MDTVNIEINGQPIAADPSQTILEVVHAQGLDRIPTLCHSDERAPYGSCFLCVVEVKGRAKGATTLTVTRNEIITALTKGLLNELRTAKEISRTI